MYVVTWFLFTGIKAWVNDSVYIDELVQERRNSSVYTLELRLSCTNPSTWGVITGLCLT